MDTTKIKKYAQFARRTLIRQIEAKLDAVIAENSPARRESPKTVKELEGQIFDHGRDQVVERVAYTWINRFSALRYMDVTDLNSVRVVSPLPGQFQPEILAEAKAGNIDESRVSKRVRDQIHALLDGRAPSQDPQAEAYRLLLVAMCNDWHEAMPFLFEKITDYTELLMPDDLLSNHSILAYTREAMTPDACKGVEIIGWLYQFYVSEKKDEVFTGLKENKKVTPENIPAATQLFTPHWIVRYLVENSLGRLWMLNRPSSRLIEKMDYYIAPEEPEEDFLRLSSPEEIKVCDPACGSGHMLTYAFDLLYAIYEEEGYDPSEIPEKILTQNLYGVEIDERAGALAAFALTMKARGKQRRFFRCGITPNICVLQPITFETGELDEYVEVVGRDLFTHELRTTLTQFEEADNFGSLIRPALEDSAEVRQAIEAKDMAGNLFLRDTHERVKQVLRMADYLRPKYHAVVANPPYMGRKGMNGKLKDFAKALYPSSNIDLFAMFMERAISLTAWGGMMGMINMQSWMFLSSFEKLRLKLTSTGTILNMAHLGPRAFDSIGGEVVSTTAFVVGNAMHFDKSGEYLRLLDGSSENEKARMILEAARDRSVPFRFTASAKDFSKIPTSPIAYWFSTKALNVFRDYPALAKTAPTKQGLATGDNDRFLRFWNEVPLNNIAFDCKSSNETKSRPERWFPCNKGGAFRKWHGNNYHVTNWQNAGAELKNFYGKNGRLRSRPQNEDYYFRSGLTWSAIASEGLSMRLSPQGHMFETKGAMCFPSEADTLPTLGFLNSPVVNSMLLALSPTLDYHEGPVGRLPYQRIASCAEIVERAVILARADWDAYEISWDFTTHPLLTPEHRADTLEGTYSCLRTHGHSMTEEMQRLEEENNRIFIDAYGLRDELPPEVPLQEITLTCNPAYRYGGKKAADELETLLLADTTREFLSYAVGCMFGRYSLDTPGLILASQGEGIEEYLAKIPEPTFEPDADNVIPVLDGDWFPDDITERFRKFLRMTFGEARFQENLAFIEDALGKKLRAYLLRDFYADHVKRYKKRPIYWMFSSPKGTFNTLIYMHRYRPDTVSVVLNDYLREFRNKLEAHRKQLQALTISAEATQGQKTKALKKIEATSKQIEEVVEWERDVLYPLATQRIEIDLDDGVKVNYPKFGAALKPIKGLSDTGG